MKGSKLKPIVLVLVLLPVGFWICVQFRNQNSKNMTGKQKMIRAIYPALMRITRALGKNTKSIKNPGEIEPTLSFYSLQTTINTGQNLSFDQFKGKKVLLVNTASECGYTPQFEELQKLHRQFADRLVIMGFPANDFGQQEKGDDQEISQFCKQNFAVDFLLAKKSTVIKGPTQNKVFAWLSHREENGWNNQQPTWNFSKYLVDERGMLAYYFDPSISPLSNEMISALSK
jgi:glutathione peroxidase